MELLKRSWAEIRLEALANNYTQLRALTAPGCKFLGVVKADAYGHGAVPVGRRLTELGAEYLGVSNLEEAMQLRRGGLEVPILILGYTPPAYAEELVRLNLDQEVHSLEYARQLNDRLSGGALRLPVHIKIDTGMSRLGFIAGEQALEAWKSVALLPHLHWAGTFTHFSSADTRGPDGQDYTRRQFSRFMAMLDGLKAMGIDPGIRHCANSAAAMLYPEYALDMIRPGIATYGIDPSNELTGVLELQPVLSLHTTISQIQTYPAGTCVSYGRSYTLPGVRTLAVLAIGYADGLNRNLSNRASFLLHGKFVPVVGRICMDMCMVDVTEVPEAKVGDTVTIFGKNGGASITVEELSNRLNTIPYEVLCDINKRVPRVYLNGEDRVEVLQYIV